MIKKVLITSAIPSVAYEMLSKNFSVTIHTGAHLDKLELTTALLEYDAILSMLNNIFTQDVFPKAVRTKIISNFAIGTDNIDLSAAKLHKIKIANTPDVVTDSTADLAMALLLTYIRKIPAASSYVQDNKWKVWEPMLFLGNELNGKKLGIIGFGRIGQAIAKRAVAFGMQVIFHTRRKVSTSEQQNFSANQVDLELLLKTSDIISLNVPKTSQTCGMIASKEFELMKDDAILLNLSRGSIVNTDSLVLALTNKTIQAALLDVTDPEPLIGHPLQKLDNCLIVPHIGTSTIECRYNMAKYASNNIINFFNT
ncbi:MAG: D-glycerate dehydrogenase [Francisellaceae bacterium]|nr:D-glycerate dehydrogenase [Francisellaceae bacterium]